MITFDTPVENIVPELANPIVIVNPKAPEYTYKPAQKKMLIKHLLNHSSGLYYFPENWKASRDDELPPYSAAAYEGDSSWKKFFELIRVCFLAMSFCAL